MTLAPAFSHEDNLTNLSLQFFSIRFAKFRIKKLVMLRIERS